MMLRMGVGAVLVALASAANPWDKYQWAPGPDRTFVPKNWSKTCGASPPPAPASQCPKGTVGGTVKEWIRTGSTVPQLALKCPGNGKFAAVKFASFGTPTGNCGTFAASKCAAANTSEWVSQQCIGKSQCTLPADTTVRDQDSPLDQALGDPCYGTAKWLSVQLACGASSAPLLSAHTGLATPKAQTPHTLRGSGDVLVYDFGQEVGGVTTLEFGATSDQAQTVEVVYSESTYYSCTGDASNGGSDDDSFLSTGVVKSGSSWSPPLSKLRGGFRYMTLKLSTFGTVEIKAATVKMVAAPNMPDPSAWAHHFFSSDEILNRVWYASGWTTQLCSINSTHGRQWPAPKIGWNNNAVCGAGDVVLVDGAKRDRVIWPGDMGVSVLTALATTGDVAASKNALVTLYGEQQKDGMLPYAGPPVNFLGGSDTYHLWALIGTTNVALLADEEPWARTVWSGFKLGVTNCVGRITSQHGLFNVVHKADWARGGQGGENIAANALLYKVLVSGASLATVLGDKATATNYTSIAAALKQAINTELWDEAAGAFKDNPTSNLHPQDGNSLVCWFNVTTATRCSSAMAVQKKNWNNFGSLTPEWHGIGTFPGSMEVHARFANGDADSAHDLIRLMWGYMLDKPESTGSSFWEGYNADGTFGYKGNYMSNAHGWATGPAAALSAHTLGIMRASVEEGPRRFVVAPQLGDLSFCQGTAALVPGEPIFVRWDATPEGTSIRIDSTAFPESLGRVVLPVPADREVGSVSIDGEPVADWRLAVENGHIAFGAIDSSTSHTVSVAYRQ